MIANISAIPQNPIVIDNSSGNERTEHTITDNERT